MKAVDLGRLFPIAPPSVPGGRWVLALGIASLLLGFFWACGVFTAPPVADESTRGVALFFSVNLAYVVPVVGFVSQRTIQALRTLTPVLGAGPAEAEGWVRRIRHKPARWLVSVLAIGVTGGLIHNLLLTDPPADLVARAAASTAESAIMAGTQLIWLVLTLAVATLLDNALLLNRIARRARAEPFHHQPLRPFATVAVLSTLGLIGTQATFPIMWIGGEVSPLAYAPGLLATGGPMLLLAALPVWPLHRRLAARKQALIMAVDERIGALGMPAPDESEAVARMSSLLGYRRELGQASEWPFDVGVLTRLLLYLIIPPATWVGAALIEHLVDSLL